MKRPHTKRRHRREPNFLVKLKYLYALGALPNGQMHMVDVEHDSWCAHFEGRPCNCSPNVKVRYSVPGGSNN
jgi:hypothetical protein